LGAKGQVALTFDPSVPLVRNGQALPMAWAGGINFAHISDIDLDGDDDKDLLLFDRSGSKVITLLNNGGAGQVNYTFTRAFDDIPPFRDLQEWVLLRDYNGDGKDDIFSYTLGGAGVWKNTSTDGALSFEQVEDLVNSNYVPTEANLYITQVDIPGIEDIDGDGDLDIITFSIFGNYLEYHKNLSMELYGTADSLTFEVRNRCWGYFSENLNNNSVALNNPCSFNVADPEMPLEDGGVEAADAARGQGAGNDARTHVGSTNLPIDLDGDGDKDLLVGDVLFRNMLALYNGGSLDSAMMVAQDSLFPVYDQPVQLSIFPTPFYEDVNNDGKRDLLVTPNYASLSENARSVWYYRNTGTDAAPVFEFEQPDLFQDRMFDVGEGAYPVPFDLDGDGLMDLIVANYGYYAEGGLYPCKMAALRNTGSATAPAFQLVVEDYMDLSTSGIGNAMHPTFGDIDGDGDKDLYIGDLQGKLHYFENTTSTPVAQFELAEPTVQNDQGQDIDVGQFATPQFFDVDGDGLLDLLVGERNGNLNYYRNDGTPAAPVWHLENDSVGGLDVAEWWNVTGYSVPCMYLNNEGGRELLVGSESGWIHHYAGIEGNLGGSWELVDSTWQDVREGARTAVALHDWNGDGHADAVIGNFRGGLSYWRNDFAAQAIDAGTVPSGEMFDLMPNPAADEVVLELRNAPVRGMRWTLVDATGRVVAEQRLLDKRVSIALGPVPPGVYSVQVSTGADRWTRRLSVVH
jgi:hypothetical protein